MPHNVQKKTITEKPFCPKSMIRYEDTAIGYKEVWVCKKCYTVFLSKSAVLSHIIKGNNKIKSNINKQQDKIKSNFIIVLLL